MFLLFWPISHCTSSFLYGLWVTIFADNLRKLESFLLFETFSSSLWWHNGLCAGEDLILGLAKLIFV